MYYCIRRIDVKKLNLTFRFVLDQIKSGRQTRSNSMRFKNYYLNSKDDKRTNFAKIFDYFIWRIITFFMVFLFLYLRINRLYASVTATSVIVIIIHSIAVRGRNFKLKQMKKQKRRHIAGQRVYNEIMNKTADEMEKYLENLFSRIGFNQISFLENAQRYILLKAGYRGYETIILFYMYRNDFEVELKEVREFFYTMLDNGVNKGILMTTSDFTNNSYDFVDKLNEKEEELTLILANKEQFLNIIEQNNLFPSEEEIDEIIESKVRRQTNRWNKYKTTALSKNNFKKYIVVSLYLVLTAWYTPYITYYIIVASAILGLAAITFIFNTIYSLEDDKENLMDFKELLNNM